MLTSMIGCFPESVNLMVEPEPPHKSLHSAADTAATQRPRFARRNLEKSGGICKRKTLFWMKKEADQSGFLRARERGQKKTKLGY